MKRRDHFLRLKMPCFEAEAGGWQGILGVLALVALVLLTAWFGRPVSSLFHLAFDRVVQEGHPPAGGQGHVAPGRVAARGPGA